MRIFLIGVAALLTSAFAFQSALAQSKDDPSASRMESVLKEKKNAWTLGIAGGLLDTTNMRFADEMGKVLNDGDELRILPIVGFGAASNLEDLLYLRGVDAAFTQSDVFEYFGKQKKISDLEKRVQFIARFPIAELHILARKEILSLEDLRGKRVSFGPMGTAASLTGTIVLERLGITVDQVFQDHTTGIQALQSGELAAIVRVAGRPLGFFADMPMNPDLHFLPVPFSEIFSDYYTLSELTAEDYPGLIPAGQSVDTLGVPTVLAVYNWPKGSPRYKRVERFVQRLFANWDKFRDPAFHPKWQEINLAATVPGWQRFPVAETMLKELSSGGTDQGMNRDFETFLDSAGNSGTPKSQAERDALFREFITWRAQQVSEGSRKRRTVN